MVLSQPAAAQFYFQWQPWHSWCDTNSNILWKQQQRTLYYV